MSHLADRLYAAEIIRVAGIRVVKVGKSRVVSVHPDFDTPELRRALVIHGLSGLDIQYTFIPPAMPMATADEAEDQSRKRRVSRR